MYIHNDKMFKINLDLFWFCLFYFHSDMAVLIQKLRRLYILNHK